MSKQLGLFHPTFNLHQYDMTMKTSILPVVNVSNLPLISAMAVFYHEGMSSFENGVMISKYWRKIYTSYGLDIDVGNILSTCAELSDMFSGNIVWTNRSTSQIITRIQPNFASEEIA